MRFNQLVMQCMLAAALTGCSSQYHRYRIEGLDPDEARSVGLAVADLQRHGCPIVLDEHGEGSIRMSSAPCGESWAKGSFCDSHSSEVEIGDRPELRETFPDWQDFVQRIAYHELYHAAGNHWHSPDPMSIMYFDLQPESRRLESCE